jgi:diadenosine tetraphosphatase ApaH/serine/threonine PP2A family protein phosphatase
MTSKTVLKSDPARDITLAVTADGMVVTIAAGDFRVGKETFNLPEPTTYTIPRDNKFRTLLFYLMKTKGTGKAVVVVDEVLEGEMPLPMTEDPDHAYLWNLASLRVPSDAQNLDGASLTVIHCKAPPPPVKKAPHHG